MAHTLSPIDRDPRRWTITEALDNQGQPAMPTEVHVAILLPNAEPTASTVWITVPVTGGAFEAVLCGYLATTQEDDLVVPARGGDIYVKQVNGSHLKAVYVERINVTR